MTSPAPPSRSSGTRELALEGEPTRKAAERARIASGPPSEESGEGGKGKGKGRGAPPPARRTGRSRLLARWIRDAFVENYPIKGAALVLALAVFVLVHSDEDIEISVYVDVGYDVPGDRILVSDPVDQVRLTVSGSRRRIQEFDERAMERVEVELAEGRSGELTFTADMFDVPQGLRVERVTPPSTSLHLEARGAARLPVDVATVGEPEAGHLVGDLRVDPERVAVEGAQSELARVSALSTREIGLSGRSASFEESVPVVEPEGTIEIVGERFVRVEVEITEEVEERPLGAMDVTLEPAPGVESDAIAGFGADPPRVDVRLRGLPRELQQIDPDVISVVVEVREGDVDGLQPRAAGVDIRGLPSGVAGEARPELVTLHPP